VAWRALREGRVCGVVKVAGGVPTEAVLRALAEEAGRILSAGLYFSAKRRFCIYATAPLGETLHKNYQATCDTFLYYVSKKF
jgi:hypothetical protein